MAGKWERAFCSPPQVLLIRPAIRRTSGRTEPDPPYRSPVGRGGLAAPWLALRPEEIMKRF
jgi:hypothetical protein